MGHGSYEGLHMQECGEGEVCNVLCSSGVGRRFWGFEDGMGYG